MFKQDGFANSNVLIIISSMCILLGGYLSLSSAAKKTFRTYKNYYSSIEDAEQLLMNLENDFQNFLQYEEDSISSPHIIDIISKYSDFQIQIEDISSGINKNFIPESTIEKISGNYTESKYGWANTHIVDNLIKEKMISQVGNDNLYIFLNELPVSNINFLDSETFHAFEECELNNYLGKKTTFWKITMFTQKIKINAIICAIPSKEEPKKIEKYSIIQREFLDLGDIKNEQL